MKTVNFFKVPHEVVEEHKFKQMSIYAKCLYLYLCKNKNRYAKSDWFWRSVATITEDIGSVSTRQIVRAKKELLSNGYVEIKRGTYEHTGKRAPDIYRVNGFRVV